MLVEISCDKFLENGRERGVIQFKPRLNVVLGDESATNSIGKSTFLLIIDFIFGGDDYITKARDVHDNIGRHAIKFCLCFDNEHFYFIRDTVYNQNVSICNSSYDKIDEMTITKYREFLREKYEVTQYDLSFRDLVSRYSRIYQRDNLDEKKPLAVFKGENAKNSVLVLLKLFDYYSGLKELEEALHDAEDKYKIFHNAVMYNYITTISTKKELEQKREQLKELRVKQEILAEPEEIKQRSIEELTRISELQKRVQLLRSQKYRLESKLLRLEMNLDVNSIPLQTDFQELKKFFPEINIKKLVEIERFHICLKEILSEEIKQEQQETQSQLKECQTELEECEKEIASFDVPSGISRKVLEKYTSIAKEVEKIELQVNNYALENELKINKSVLQKQLNEDKTLLVAQLQNDINTAMQRINNFIYEGKKQSPILSLTHSNYEFFTPNDTGTGTAYKSLIVFDLAILQLTNLPFLIHDSLIFKNVADVPIERILELYQGTGKQIFIALDKASSYTNKTQMIFNDSTILKLSDNGHELFGKSWGDTNSKK